MRVYFARHGETDWNALKHIQGSRDIPLNATGRAQAQLLADRLAAQGARIARVYTSPLCRAVETAETVAARFGCGCEVLPGLAEIDFGDWEGMSWSEVRESDPAAFKHFQENRRTQRPPHGESCQDALDRLLPDVGRVLRLADPQGGEILFLTHSAVLKAFLCRLNGPVNYRPRRNHGYPLSVADFFAFSDWQLCEIGGTPLSTFSISPWVSYDERSVFGPVGRVHHSLQFNFV